MLYHKKLEIFPEIVLDKILVSFYLDCSVRGGGASFGFGVLDSPDAPACHPYNSWLSPPSTELAPWFFAIKFYKSIY